MALAMNSAKNLVFSVVLIVISLLHGTELYALAIGNLYIEKQRQNSSLKLDYKNAFELN